MNKKQIQKNNWKKEILKSCIEAEKLYQLQSDKTDKSWLAIYNANVINKISNLLKQQKEKLQDQYAHPTEKRYIKELKKMKIHEAEGWELADKFNCCPGDDMADAYNQAIDDIIKKYSNSNFEQKIEEIIEKTIGEVVSEIFAKDELLAQKYKYFIKPNDIMKIKDDLITKLKTHNK